MLAIRQFKTSLKQGMLKTLLFLTLQQRIKALPRSEIQPYHRKKHGIIIPLFSLPWGLLLASTQQNINLNKDFTCTAGSVWYCYNMSNDNKENKKAKVMLLGELKSYQAEKLLDYIDRRDAVVFVYDLKKGPAGINVDFWYNGTNH